MRVLRDKVVIFMMVMVFSTLVFADGENDRPSDPKNDEVNEGIDYPGQVSRDSEGNKIKRWSTQGPVVINDPPIPSNNQNTLNAPSGAFINVLPKQNNPRNHRNEINRKVDAYN